MKEMIALEQAHERASKDLEQIDVLLEGLPEVDAWGQPRQAIFEQMARNQVKAMENENFVWPPNAMEATTNTSAAVPALTGNILPILRRFYSDMEPAFDLVMTVPMTAPTGKAIWINEKYGTDEAGGTPDAVTADDRTDVSYSYTYSDEASEGADAKDVYIDTSSCSLDTTTKKIRTAATIQTVQDFDATIGVRYESATTQAMANIMRREIGGVIIKDLYNNAIGNVNWAATGSLVSTYVDQAAWKKTIIDAVVDAQNLVYTGTYKMPRTLVASPSFWAYFRKAVATDFEVNPKLVGQPEAINSRYYAGVTSDGLRCYVDPTVMTANTAMVLYRGNEFNDAAGIYAPYVPLWMTPPDYNTTTGNYSRLALSRYGVVNQAGATNETWVNNSIVLQKNLIATITITGS